ncbi:MAG: winged helix-turn-helix domain-containing protein [bacterium]
MVSQTKYSRIADHLDRRIATTPLQHDDSLPSERQLAAELSVSCGSVRSDYDVLYRFGVVDRQRGRGTFVTDRTRARRQVRQSRIGLLAVDMDGCESSILRYLTHDMQRLPSRFGIRIAAQKSESRPLGNSRTRYGDDVRCRPHHGRGQRFVHRIRG